MELIIILLALTVILTGIFFYISSRMYKINQEPHKQTPGDFGIDFNEVFIPAKNNCRLYGWWIPAKETNPVNSPTLILVHGWKRNVARVLPYIQELHPKGFNLLAFDSRNHGSSDPDHHSSMLKFSEDIMSSIDFIRGMPDFTDSKIGLVGLSIGGAGSIYASAIDPRITSIVTVGAFGNPAEVMKLDMQKRHIPYFPFIMLFLAYVQNLMGVKFIDIAPVNNIARSKAEISVNSWNRRQNCSA